MLLACFHCMHALQSQRSTAIYIAYFDYDNGIINGRMQKRVLCGKTATAMRFVLFFFVTMCIALFLFMLCVLLNSSLCCEYCMILRYAMCIA